MEFKEITIIHPGALTLFERLGWNFRYCLTVLRRELKPYGLLVESGERDGTEFPADTKYFLSRDLGDARWAPEQWGLI